MGIKFLQMQNSNKKYLYTFFIEFTLNKNDNNNDQNVINTV